MTTRSLRLAASLIVVCASISSCTAEAPNPVGVQSIRLAVIANAEHGGAPFSVAMTQEVSTINTPNPPYHGDADGTGTALLTVNHGQATVCWELSVSGITLPATAAHIHKGAALVRGPIVVGLSAPDANGHASGCVSDRDRDLLRDILSNPAEYYVNVHTTDFPPGAIRSQLAH